MGSQVTRVVKNPLPMQETQEMWVQSLNQEDPLEEGMATHSCFIAWRIPWTEEPVAKCWTLLKQLNTHICMCAKSLQSCRFCVTLWTVAQHVPLSMEFSRQEHWSGVPCPSPSTHIQQIPIKFLFPFLLCLLFVLNMNTISW